MKWSPAELPCAPRPINAELLSSWLRRVAAANDLTLPEIEACIGNRLGEEEGWAVPDFRPSKQWRLAVSALARVPERWVWVLGLDQHFPAADSDLFVHERMTPYGLGASFCPECFQEQIATKKPLHMKAEWALATTTRCFRHHLPLYLWCPWCGRDDPVHFRGTDAVECLDCEHDLTIRRWQWRMPIFEPVITGLEQVIAEAFAGKAPHPGWAGEINAASFRRLITDLIWTLTTEDLADAHFRLALVDRIVPGRFALREPYGWDVETRFYCRSPAAREAVVAAMLLILRGAEADDALGISGKDLGETAEFRPFVEMLRFAGEDNDDFWKHVRKWPSYIQDRAGGALRYLRSRRELAAQPKRKRVTRRSAIDSGKSGEEADGIRNAIECPTGLGSGSAANR